MSTANTHALTATYPTYNSHSPPPSRSDNAIGQDGAAVLSTALPVLVNLSSLRLESVPRCGPQCNLPVVVWGMEALLGNPGVLGIGRFCRVVAAGLRTYRALG